MFKTFWKFLKFIPKTIRGMWRIVAKIFSILIGLLGNTKKKKIPGDSQKKTSHEKKNEPFIEPPRDFSLPGALQKDVPHDEIDGIADEP